MKNSAEAIGLRNERGLSPVNGAIQKLGLVIEDFAVLANWATGLN